MRQLTPWPEPSPNPSTVNRPVPEASGPVHPCSGPPGRVERGSAALRGLHLSQTPRPGSVGDSPGVTAPRPAGTLPRGDPRPPGPPPARTPAPGALTLPAAPSPDGVGVQDAPELGADLGQAGQVGAGQRGEDLHQQLRRQLQQGAARGRRGARAPAAPRPGQRRRARLDALLLGVRVRLAVSRRGLSRAPALLASPASPRRAHAAEASAHRHAGARDGRGAAAARAHAPPVGRAPPPGARRAPPPRRPTPPTERWAIQAPAAQPGPDAQVPRPDRARENNAT